MCATCPFDLSAFNKHVSCRSVGALQMPSAVSLLFKTGVQLTDNCAGRAKHLFVPRADLGKTEGVCLALQFAQHLSSTIAAFQMTAKFMSTSSVCMQRSVRARAAAPVAAAESTAPAQALRDVGRMPASQREALAHQFGFRSIGKELPEGTKLAEIVKSLPKDVFEIDNKRSWLTALTSLVAFPASLALIHASPAWFLPVAWFLSGTAFTGWFVVGHDCGHRSFHTNKLVEDIVGNLFFAPLLYPFEPWRIKHNQHHAFTNKLEQDTAWHPVMKEEVADMKASGAAGAHRPRLSALCRSCCRGNVYKQLVKFVIYGLAQQLAHSCGGKTTTTTTTVYVCRGSHQGLPGVTAQAVGLHLPLAHLAL